MWRKKRSSLARYAGFFLVALSHDTLVNYFQMNFSLMQHHKYSLTELENMMPWEREIYVHLLMQHLKEQREEQQRRQMSQG
jgi:hypothetical protein